MTRLAIAIAVVLLAGSSVADGCKPDIPDDLELACIDGAIVAVSRSAKQYMRFEHWRCQKGTST